MPKAKEYIYRPARDGDGKVNVDALGSLVLAEEAEPKKMEGDRILYIHEPPPSPMAAKPGILILMDGQREVMPPETDIPSTPTILDGLYESKQLAPQVSVFIPPGPEGREHEYACSDDFTAFLNQKLIPLLRMAPAEGGFGCSDHREQTTIGGTSLGGLAATHAALSHPETFGNVIAQSPGFWWYRGWEDINEAERFNSTNGREAGAGSMAWLDNSSYPKYDPKHSINFYVEGGEKEGAPPNFPPAKETNTLFKERLLEREYQHTVLNSHMTEGEHSERFWQANKASALVALQPSPELLAAREINGKFRAGVPHRDPTPAASVTAAETREDDSSMTPLQTTLKPQ